MRNILLLFIIAFFTLTGRGQTGILDTTFGTRGVIITQPASKGNISPEYAMRGFAHPDGKISIVVELAGTAVVSQRLANGDKDLSYGKNSFSDVVTMNITAGALQPDGKIIVGGITNDRLNFAFARFNTDGTLDASFGNKGITTGFGSSYCVLYDITLQNNGKIIASGSSQHGGNTQFTIIRYNANGVPDGTFGINGIVTTDFDNINSESTCLISQPDGKIIAAGTVLTNEGGDFALARFNTDGSPDLSFNAIGRLTTNFGYSDHATSLVLQGDGKIYVGGTSTDITGAFHFRIIRYNADGSTDLSYNNGSGSMTAGFGDWNNSLTTIRLQPDGKLLAAGNTDLNQGKNQDFELIRINSDGSVDNSFGINGLVTSDINSDYDQNYFMTILDDGKFITGGANANANRYSTYDFTVFRYDINGTPDPSFGAGGSIIDYMPGDYFSYTGLHLQNDGKLSAISNLGDATNTWNFLSRFNADGKPDNSFGQNGVLNLNIPQIGAVFFQPDDKLIVTGVFNSSYMSDFQIARYNADGTPDESFGDHGIVITDLGGNESSGQVAIQPDGKLIVSGSRSYDDGTTDWVIARYNANGSLDVSFGNAGSITVNNVQQEFINYIAVSPDGKFLIGGMGYTYPPDFSFINIDGILSRFNSNGTADLTFGHDGKYIVDKNMVDFLAGLVIQQDGKILFSSGSGNGSYSYSIDRLNVDGSPDLSFGLNGEIASDENTTVILQKDQKILGLGAIINDLGNHDLSLSRYNPDGSVDVSFGNNGKTITSFTPGDDYTLNFLLSNNSLYVAGSGTDQSYVAVAAKYLLETSSCPASKTVNTDKGKCSAKVLNIDPTFSAENTLTKYKLTGATKAAGVGSVSGKIFNKGITTVTYTSGTDATKSCSFTITVQDNEPPVIENLKAIPATLWPADHKMKEVTVNYSTNDNCGVANVVTNVTSSEPVISGERGDESPDWQITDNHRIKLRAERLSNGNGRVYTIKVTVTDLSGNQSSQSVQVTVPKAIVNPNCNLSITASPNPSQNYFIININSSCHDRISLRILNDKGIVVATLNNLYPGQTVTTGEKFSRGVYFVEAMQSGTTKTIKLIKQ